MPILAAGVPVIQRPENIVSPLLDSRRLAFRRLDGTPLLEFTGNEFFALWGAENIDVPDRVAIEGTMPEVDGSFVDEVRIDSRKLTLPIFFGTKSGHAAHIEDRSYLRSLFQHRTVNLAEHDGSFDVVATSVTGERTLRCLYLSGLSQGWMPDTQGSWWMKVPLTLLAPRVYWYGPRWETPTIRKPSGAPWFGPFPGELSSSRAFGTNIPVTVSGDVESWARVDAVGPCDSLLVDAADLHVSIPDGLSAGETVRIDTDPRVRRNGHTVTFDGFEDWSRVEPDDSWAPLQPGLQMVDLVLPGATEQTSAVVSGDTRWESPW